MTLPAAGQGKEGARPGTCYHFCHGNKPLIGSTRLGSEHLLFSKWEVEPVALELGSIALLHSAVGEKFLSFKLLV